MNGFEKMWSRVGYTGGAQGKTMINPIMLRFRPIAPKPVSGESGSDGARVDNKNLLLCKPRAKRKYVRVKKNNIRRKKRSSSESDPLVHNEASKNPENIVTLQLLPDKTEGNGSVNNQNGRGLEENQDPLYLSNLNININININNRWFDRMGVVEEPDRTALMSQRRKETAVESWVTVESVTGSCMGVKELGGTDVERIKNLEADTCPGFISDGLHMVQWVNGAYKRLLMVVVGEANDGEPPSPPPEIKVWLVLKQELPRFCTAFSCKVRLQYMWQKEKVSRMLPCDVWKMDGGGGGGFAWRLDVEAALSLGR
ncbi:DIG-like 4 [Hibiscus trionum]|uniref:DIG-like 4 n=1 Tax=Hibiscus trionum TaxID=183268 RepID=A0A9W7IYM7_HIBTR|nr:DIG-like 4 [Hibiscus trionum]